MNCKCHGEPAYWHKKKDMRAGGLWRCGVRKREVQRRDWYAPNGGYIRERRRKLAAQRVRIVDQLDQLAQEAVSAES